MRVLRYNMIDPEGEGPNIVVREVDIIAPLEEVAVHYPGAFAVVDIFEMDDDATHEQAAQRAVERAEEAFEVESKMASLYYTLVQYERIVCDSGVIALIAPPGLTIDHVKDVLKQFATYPTYKGQRVVMTVGMDQVGMHNGDINVSTAPA